MTTSSSRTSPVKQTVIHAIGLALCSLVSYELMTHILSRTYSVSRDDDLLGGMWAVAATIFVYRTSLEESVNAALSRTAATWLSFVLCFLYLLFFPFQPWGMAVLIAFGAIAMELAGRSQDIITTTITIAVIMVVVAISPQHAWQQPLLRLVDTIVGVLVGLAGGWAEVRLTARGPSQSAIGMQRT